MSNPNTGPVNFIRFRMEGRELSGVGRDAWALSELVNAGAMGVTPITHPGPRWSAYVRKWRVRGVDIETIHETHGGAFAGRHARYRLRSQIEVIETKTAPAAGNAVAA